ncbi:cytoskeleton-associated protein 2-like [Nematostella vectensis]|uniref:cytoskeleton-associated protein 2-like n=1 Tax=Nematostella vectensis TaxID=45351 RepID=UPI00207778F8|nr:cytoskeleton-associated protein 2-like [Nematostella vectensis]
MADKKTSTQRHSVKTQDSMRERLEKWRQEKQRKREVQNTANNRATTSGLKRTLLASKERRKPLQVSNAVPKPPCTCKPEVSVQHRRAESMTMTSSTKKKNVGNITNMGKNTTRDGQNGNLQRLSERIQAANEKRDSLVKSNMYKKEKAMNKKPAPKISKGMTYTKPKEVKKKQSDNARKPDKNLTHNPTKKIQALKRSSPTSLSYPQKDWLSKKPKNQDIHTRYKQQSFESKKNMFHLKKEQKQLLENQTQVVSDPGWNAEIKGTASAYFQVNNEIQQDENTESTSQKDENIESTCQKSTSHQDKNIKSTSQQDKNIKSTSQQEVKGVDMDNPFPVHVAVSQTPAAVRSYMNKSMSMRERLELWRQEKGKTPKPPKTPSTAKRARPSSYVMQGPFSDGSSKKALNKSFQEIPDLDEFETMSCDNVEKQPISDKLREKLQDCYDRLLKDEHCDESVASELDDLQGLYACALLCAEFWVCRAKIAERQGDDGRVVCFFEQALVFRAEPESLLKNAVTEYMAKKKGHQQVIDQDDEIVFSLPDDEKDAPPPNVQTPDPAARPKAPTVDDVPSSVVKYSVTKATPFKSRLQACERSVITPVRRSARLERRSISYPAMLQDHDLVVANLGDLSEDTRKEAVYKPNFAVEAELNEAWKEMWEAEL